MFREPWVVQKFLPQVSLGDKRIILVDGEPLGAVNRVPVGDDIRSNMVRGGSARETDLTAREREICARIGPELKRRGLIFVGIDVIDGHLTEINVTSPTGLRAIQRLGGPNLAAAIWDVIEAKRRGVTRGAYFNMKARARGVGAGAGGVGRQAAPGLPARRPAAERKPVLQEAARPRRAQGAGRGEIPGGGGRLVRRSAGTGHIEARAILDARDRVAPARRI